MIKNDFTNQEFATRRQQLAERMNDDAIAIIPGADCSMGSELFRQYNDFYYLCGVEVPHCYLIIESANAKSTLFLPNNAPLDFKIENSHWIKEKTGIDEIQPTSQLISVLSLHRRIYLPGREGEGLKMSSDNLRDWKNQVMVDPLDQRVGRITEITNNIRRLYPLIELKDLSPIIDDLRSIKSPAEIALLRKVGELTGLGALAAMRTTRPGKFEYNLNAAAQKVYLDNGARGEAYVPIIPVSKNAGDAHYHLNQSVLENGDIVLFDCAPDYRYYTSDIGRMWPVNGQFDGFQSALYGYLVNYHKVILSLIKPGMETKIIHEEASKIMNPVFEKWKFVSEEQRETARILFTFEDHISHGVGMCAHDVSFHRQQPFKEGMVFAVDPMAWDRNRNVYYRVEDTVVVTKDGCEVLTDSCPIEIDDIEREILNR